MRTLLIGLLLVFTALPPAAEASDDAPSVPPRVSPDESVLSEYTPEARPNPNPPPYTLLRFNEDYTYLANPRNRTDPVLTARKIHTARTDGGSDASR